jgi:hypothetical protein
LNVNTYQMKTITLNDQEWALVKEAITHLRESVSDDMMHFQEVSDKWDGNAPTTLAEYAITAASDAADKVCLIDQLNAKVITVN